VCLFFLSRCGRLYIMPSLSVVISRQQMHNFSRFGSDIKADSLLLPELAGRLLFYSGP
jgi:hypothetical protein